MMFGFSESKSGFFFASGALEQEQPVQEITCELPVSLFNGIVEIYFFSMIDELVSFGFTEACELQHALLMSLST